MLMYSNSESGHLAHRCAGHIGVRGGAERTTCIRYTGGTEFDITESRCLGHGLVDVTVTDTQTADQNFPSAFFPVDSL